MDLRLGSNAFRNSNGVVIVQGKEQIVLEFPPGTLQLLLTMDLYDAGGARVAHVRRNAWGFDKRQAFHLSSGPASPTLFTDHAWVKITDRATGETVLHAQVVDQDVVELTEGRFHSHTGQLVEICSHYCRISGGMTLFGDVKEMRQEPVRLG